MQEHDKSNSQLHLVSKTCHKQEGNGVKPRYSISYPHTGKAYVLNMNEKKQALSENIVPKGGGVGKRVIPPKRNRF